MEGSKLHLRTSSLLEPRYPTAGAADQAVSERPSVSSATTRGLVLRGQQGCRSPEDRSELCPHAPKQARHGLPGPTEGHPQTTPATSCQDPPGDAPKPRQPPPARAHRGTPHHVQGLAHQHTHTCTFPRTRSQAHTHSLAGRGMTPLLGDVHRTPLGVKADVVPPSQGGALWLDGAGWLLICMLDPENHGGERRACAARSGPSSPSADSRPSTAPPLQARGLPGPVEGGSLFLWRTPHPAPLL